MDHFPQSQAANNFLICHYLEIDPSVGLSESSLKSVRRCEVYGLLGHVPYNAEKLRSSSAFVLLATALPGGINIVIGL